ncbi:MAG: trypsin-like peptidase domain-containing protein [Ginsengibacter sp.]
MKTKNIVFTVILSGLTSLAVILGFNYFQNNNSNPNFHTSIPSNYKFAGLYDSNGNQMGAPIDFTQAASAAIPTVVHIKTKTTPKQTNNLPKRGNPFSDLLGDDMFEQFFGQGRGQQSIVPQMGSGSGVIISNDGYIITNNHVVAGADEVTVTLSDRKTYTAKVVGADPAFDLAVVKVDAKNLPFMLYGTSHDVNIGQWVLAIGYPLNLDATVTAGIISAKSRALGLNRDRAGSREMAVESYLQTDAAVNMGNSGGALINTKGLLIGINSAIASPTGYYNGYSYAIPVDIVKKVVNDLIKYGNVQRGFLGVRFLEAGSLNKQQKEENKVPASAEGIFVTDVVKDGAAAAAGIKEGDIIRKVNGVDVQTGAELQEQIAQLRPGEKVTVVYERGGKQSTVNVTLKNNAGTFDIVKAASMIDNLGADLEDLDPKKAREYNLAGGIVVKRIKEGAINDQTRMRDGFIITMANGKPVKTVDDLKTIIGNNPEVTIEGVYPGYNEPFEYPLILNIR